MRFVLLETAIIIPNFLNITLNCICAIVLLGSHSVMLKSLCLFYIMFISF